MNTEIISLFPTLVMAVHDFITKDQCNDIVEYCKSKNLKANTVFIGDAVSSHEGEGLITDLFDISLNVKSCENIFNHTEHLIQNYTQECGYHGTHIVNSWINIQKKGSVLIEHAHPQSSVSGVLYLKVDELSSNLFFKTPNPFVYYSMMTQKHKIETVVPKTGSLILFPSWLVHGSNQTENQSEERIVLSFNCK